MTLEPQRLDQPADAATGAPRVLVSTVPKSGTHLLDSILCRMPPLARQQRLGLNANLRWHPLNFLPFVGRETCWMGIGRPRRVRVAAVAHALRRIGPWRYGMGQIPYQPVVMQLLERYGIRAIVAIRDPRDVLVSLMHHIVDKRNHFLHGTLGPMTSDRDRLRALIVGTRSPGGELRRGVAHQLDLILGWLDDPAVLTVRFEDLVGSRGGGSDAAQRRAILQIASHIGIPLRDADAERVGREMFGTGRTFRKGLVGAWRECFDAELTALFHGEVGERLSRMGYEA